MSESCLPGFVEVGRWRLHMGATLPATAEAFIAIAIDTVGLPPGLTVLDPHRPRITLRVQTKALGVDCPSCGSRSVCVHARYWRRIGDLACFGRPTDLLVRVRRFRCRTSSCPRRTFAERLPGTAPVRARQTGRLRDVHRGIGMALGGNAGARLAATLGIGVSGTTLLRCVRAGTDASVRSPVLVLGVGDWAWRKGNRYGTILCDLERRRVADLLPDRAAATLAAWLKGHPTVTIVVRDRAGAYGDGARQGAPDAVQVADRWHLLRNGGDALRDVVTRHHREVREAARKAAAVPPPPLTDDPPEPPVVVVPERSSCRSARPGRPACS